MWRTKGAVGHHASPLPPLSAAQGPQQSPEGATWDSGSSLTQAAAWPALASCPGHSPTARVSLDQSLEPRSTVWIPQVLRHCPFAYP